MPGVFVGSRARFFSLLVVGALLAQSNVAVAVAPDAATAPDQEERAPADTTGWTIPMTPFQLSLFKPAQIFSPATPVRGIRVNLIYGEQASVWGVDVGSVNRTTSEMLGFQYGVVNLNQDFAGLQYGLFNESGGDFAGFQYGLINRVGGNFAGIQYGLANISTGDDQSLLVGMRASLLFGHQARLWGLDVGLLNMTSEDMRGVQIGLVNTNLGNALGLQLALVNWTSGDFTGVQSGFINVIEGSSRSFQLGFYNESKSLKGVQIGLLNINGSRRPLIFFPAINVGW